jgi:hypothetical protein
MEAFGGKGIVVSTMAALWAFNPRLACAVSVVRGSNYGI